MNTTSKDLKLGNGAVSASLLKAGGPILQQECDQNYPQGIQHGDIAVTSGGNLYCQSICHGSLPGWDQKGAALKVRVEEETFIWEFELHLIYDVR